MAVHLATGSDYLQRTTGLLSPSSNSTVMFWVKMDAVIAAYQPLYAFIDNPAVFNEYDEIWLGNPNPFGTNPGLTLFNQVSLSPPFSGLDAADPIGVSKWTHITKVQSGTTHRVYINGTIWSAYRHSTGSVGDGAGQTSFTLNFSTAVIGFEFLGGEGLPDGEGNFDLAYFRSWNTALTGAQIQQEMGSSQAWNTGSLWMDTPLVSDLLDISGNGRNWTQIGSGVFSDAVAPLAANSFYTNATDLGTLPASITESRTGLGQPNFWYRYTGQATDVVFGFWAFSSLSDTLSASVWSAPAAQTDWLDIGGDNVPMQIPISDAQTIYVLVQSITPLSADVAVSALPNPIETIPTGAIFTNDDIVGFPVAVIGPTSYSVERFFALPATNSENGGDVLENGLFLIAADDTSKFQLYNAQLSLVATVSGITSTASSAVRTCVTPQVFYVGETPATTGIARIDASGAVTDTWTMPNAGIIGLAAMNDESLIYVTGNNASQAVRRFNPNTSTFTTDLVAAVGGYHVGDVLVTGDDSVLVVYLQSPGTGLFVRRYDSSGATLNTYTLGATAEKDVSLFHALDDPTSFWVRAHDIVAAGTCTFYNIKCSDGTILATINQATYEGGVYQAAASATPLARFGVSVSCPSFILRTPVVVSSVPVEYLIRRERWFPHLSQEQFRQFFLMLQIDLQAGNGLGNVDSTTVGFNPILEVDWSDDGGWTWSSLRFPTSGAIGAYTQRAIVRRLGYGRDRVFRIACTDPVQWVVINGYLQAVLGTS